MRTSFVALIAALVMVAMVTISAQDASPSLRAGALTSDITIDGRLNEAAWDSAASTDAFTQVDPSEGAAPTARTLVRVLAGARALVIGIVCEEPDPSGIVSFSVRRDADLSSEDHVRIVLGPFADGRSGYVFAVNPSGARYDGVSQSRRRELTARIGTGSGRPRPPGCQTAGAWRFGFRCRRFTFKRGLHEWHFNVQRRIQGRLETGSLGVSCPPVPGDADQSRRVC